MYTRSYSFNPTSVCTMYIRLSVPLVRLINIYPCDFKLWDTPGIEPVIKPAALSEPFRQKRHKLSSTKREVQWRYVLFSFLFSINGLTISRMSIKINFSKNCRYKVKSSYWRTERCQEVINKNERQLKTFKGNYTIIVKWKYNNVSALS